MTSIVYTDKKGNKFTIKTRIVFKHIFFNLSDLCFIIEDEKASHNWLDKEVKFAHPEDVVYLKHKTISVNGNETTPIKRYVSINFASKLMLKSKTFFDEESLLECLIKAKQDLLENES